MLSVNRSSITRNWFIMDNRLGIDGKAKGQLPGTFYYTTYREATIVMLHITDIPNYLSLSEKAYRELVNNK